MKKGMNYLRENGRGGASLAYVACISALLVAFALAMTYTAGMMLSGANKRIAEERCYQLAKSYAEVLDAELGDETSSFYRYACKFMSSSYASYSPDNKENTTYQYGTDQTSEGYGAIGITLYKVVNEEDGGLRETLAYAEDGNYTTLIESLKGAKHLRYMFVVTVTAAYEDFVYQYTTEYDCEEQLMPRFYHGGKVICWDAVHLIWREGEDAVNGVGYDTGRTLITEADPVQYEMRTDDDGVIHREFRNVYEEAAVPGEGGAP